MNMRVLGCLLCAATALAAATTAQTYDFQAAARYSEARNGHALLVAIDGKIVFERYANGWSASWPHRLASGTKSFNGVLLAMAVEDGLLKFDELLADTLTEWKSDRRKSKITYRQLLSLQSGIIGGTSGQRISYAQAIKAPTFADPGTRFRYGPIPYQIFGEALKRKLAPRRQSVADYIKSRLLDPLGMVVSFWLDWGKGEPRLPGGARMTAREWVKFGELVRRGGVAGGKRLVAKALLDETLRPSPVLRSYGMTWWLPVPGQSQPDDQVAAKGAGTQRLYVIRSHRMVIVRFAENTGRWSDDAFIEALMPATFARFGRGCGRAGAVPLLDAAAGQRPVIGASFAVRVTNLRAGATGAIYLGASNERFGTTTLPWDLTSFGMTGCALLVSLDLTAPFTAAAGTVTQRMQIPNDKDLVTKSIYLQAAVLDRTANALGVVLSNGGAGRVGVR